MDLILWRHAEAVPEKPGQDDMQRALTPKGERQAQRMAEWLNQRLAHSTRILVSPALRTQQTAKAIGRNFKTIEAIKPADVGKHLSRGHPCLFGAHAVFLIGNFPQAGDGLVVSSFGVGQPRFRFHAVHVHPVAGIFLAG